VSAPDPALTSKSAEVEKTLGIGVYKKKRSYVWPVVIALILIGGGLLGFRALRARGNAVGPGYETVKVARADLAVTITATGTLQGLGTIEVGAEVSGRVVQVLVDYNDQVEVGQTLALIDPEQSQAASDQARAGVAAAEAAIAVAKATVDESQASLARAEEQHKEQLVSLKDLEGARANAARARANYQSAVANATVSRANLKSAQSKLSKTKVISPAKGVVLSRLVEPGQTLTAGFTTPVLFKLTEDLRKMSLEVYVDEADVGRIKQGLEATFSVDAYPGKIFASRVKSIHNEAKTENNVVSYEAVLEADNSEMLLRPGMTATATIVSEKKEKALLVPNAALRFIPPAAPKGFGPPGAAPPPATGPHVYVVDGLSAKLVLVKPGATDGTNTEILEGPLEVGAEVIIDIKDSK
jgi:HlyD family secretion protein